MAHVTVFKKGTIPEWTFEDFFKLADLEKESLRKALAQHFEVAYGSINMGMPAAHSIDGVAFYKEKEMQNWHTAYTQALNEQQVPAMEAVSVVVNGCMVAWPYQ